MDGYWSFDAGTVFPVPSNTDNPAGILSLTDPVLFQICTFFQQLINTNLAPRFSQEAMACGVTHANLDNWVDGVGVGETISFPIKDIIAQSTDLKFPLLSIHTVSEEYDHFTLTNIATKRTFQLAWILPPLVPAQYNRLYSFLQEVSKIILGYGVQGYDPKVNPNGPSAWATAGLSFGTFENANYIHYDGVYKDRAGKTQKGKFPCLEMNFSFWERNQMPVPQNYPTPFSGVSIQENFVPDGYNSANPINNFIDGYSVPNITLTSVSPSSGSIQGNTLLVIKGTGFLPAKLKSPSQLTICGAPALQVQMRSPTIMMAITNVGIAGTAGQVGDIVFTDLQGNTYTLADSYTYTSP